MERKGVEPSTSALRTEFSLTCETRNLLGFHNLTPILIRANFACNTLFRHRSVQIACMNTVHEKHCACSGQRAFTVHRSRSLCLRCRCPVQLGSTDSCHLPSQFSRDWTTTNLQPRDTPGRLVHSHGDFEHLLSGPAAGTAAFLLTPKFHGIVANASVADVLDLPG